MRITGPLNIQVVIQPFMYYIAKNAHNPQGSKLSSRPAALTLPTAIGRSEIPRVYNGEEPELENWTHAGTASRLSEV